MTTTLTDRYVYAATRWLPGRLRDEVDAELRERIADTVAAHGNTPEAERITLEELGDPLRVAVDYTGREPALIGPRLFFQWLRLTMLIVAIVVPLVTAIVVLVGAFEGDSLGAIIGSAAWTLLQVTIHIVFWTTVVFVVLEWTNTPADVGPWSVDQLPQTQSSSGLSDLIASLVFLPVFAALVVWQHVGSPFFEDGERIAMADPSLWSWYLPLVLVVLALELGHALWLYRTGWTWATAWANLALGLLFAVPTIIVLLRDEMINPQLVAHLSWDTGIVANAMTGIAASVALISAWEIFDGFRRAYGRSRVRA